MKKGTGKEAFDVEWKRIGFGVAVASVGLLAMTGLGAWLLEREVVEFRWIDYLSAVILLASSFLGAKVTGASPERWIGPVLTGLGLWLVLAVIHVFCFGGALEGAGATALAIIGGTGAAVLLRRGGNRSGRPRRKYRNR